MIIPVEIISSQPVNVLANIRTEEIAQPSDYNGPIQSKVFWGEILLGTVTEIEGKFVFNINGYMNAADSAENAAKALFSGYITKVLSLGATKIDLRGVADPDKE